ncbi:MAG TPA: hypothetical protein VH437_08985 [Terriglobales bacterium]|jgi:hypothetical protein
MITALKLITITLAVGAICLAQDDLTIRGNDKQVWAADAQKVYLSACSAIEREFRMNRPLRPRVTLIVGARTNEAYWKSREIRLTKWDPYLFAQGVVIFAFEELLPERERIAVASRAVGWPESTVSIESLAK